MVGRIVDLNSVRWDGSSALVGMLDAGVLLLWRSERRRSTRVIQYGLVYHQKDQRAVAYEDLACKEPWQHRREEAACRLVASSSPPPLDRSSQRRALDVILPFIFCYSGRCAQRVLVAQLVSARPS